MNYAKEYDVAIIGGGLAGLATSILLRHKGYAVILFEKEKFPFHKVCGEYISMESWDFIEKLGIPLRDLSLPLIKQLFLTAPGGKSFITTLPLGGFGISRYKLDHLLAQKAIEAGVHLMEETKVQDVSLGNEFLVEAQSKLQGSIQVKAKVCCSAHGKKSNLDLKWKREYLHQKSRLDNYVAVKYHIRTHWQADLIGLHNFENGYCGIAKIEEDKYCCCYLTTAQNLKISGNNIKSMEENILSVNPHLGKIFSNMDVLPGFPVTISQVSFQKKSQVENGILMLGDAAGMITPLCGNGMSIAMHTAKIADAAIHDFLQNKTTRNVMEQRYVAEWKQNFSRRLLTGRILQGFFGSKLSSNIFVSMFRTFPFLAKPVVKMTHGEPF